MSGFSAGVSSGDGPSGLKCTEMPRGTRSSQDARVSWDFNSGSRTFNHIDVGSLADPAP